LAVFVQVSGIANRIYHLFNKKPIVSIILATLIGALSPFCSCGVIPIITSLLIGGVPLAPVMSFWIASPSMDPEVLFLSAATLGWKLSLWRLVATFVISLFAGLFIHLAINKKWIDNNMLLDKHTKSNCGNSCNNKKEIEPLHKKMIKESWKAISMVAKFMSLAFFINAIIHFYLPQNFLGNILMRDNFTNVFLGAIVGIPFYTSNITAIPLVSGLLNLGINPGAILAFLIAGPTTTLPAMVAVYGITKKKIFLLYLSFSFFGALIFGLLFNLV